MRIAHVVIGLCLLAADSSSADQQKPGFALTVDRALAVASPLTGKAGGGATDRMSLACQLPTAGQTLECSTLAVGPPRVEQTWKVTPREKCNMTAKPGCEFVHARGSFLLRVVVTDGVGRAQFRMDMAMGDDIISAKVCAGTFATK